MSSNLTLLCDDCPFATLERRSLVNHTRIAHLKRQFLVCPFSPDRKLLASSLRGHVRRFHENSAGLECFDCGLRRSARRDLLRHTLSHVQLSHPVECDRCGSCLRNQLSLQIHSRRGQCVQRSDWPSCFDCGYEARHKKQIVAHVQLKHAMLGWPCVERLQCSDCVYSTSFRRSLFNHFASAHAKSLRVRWRCYDCDKCLTSRSAAHLHQRFVHRSYGGVTKPCDRCGAVLNTLSMRYHQKTAKCIAQAPLKLGDQVDRRIQCFDCDDGHLFARRSFFKHQRSKHGRYGDATLQCENCLDRVGAHHLVVHKKTEKCRKLGEMREKGIADLRPFHCFDCPKAFVKHHVLELHQKNVHKHCVSRAQRR